jgi:hypothetical protein
MYKGVCSVQGSHKIHENSYYLIKKKRSIKTELDRILFAKVGTGYIFKKLYPDPFFSESHSNPERF